MGLPTWEKRSGWPAFTGKLGLVGNDRMVDSACVQFLLRGTAVVLVVIVVLVVVILGMAA